MRSARVFFFGNSFFGSRLAGLGGARVCDFIPFPLVRRRSSRGNGMRRLAGFRVNFSFRGSRGFLRTRDFTLRARSTLVVVGDNSSFFDFPAFRMRRKRN
jgi:hypothetical protein